MAKKIVPSEFKAHLVQQMVESLFETANTSYYAFLGNHIATGVTQDDVNQPNASLKDLSIDTYRDMIFGKKLDITDMRVMVPRYDWVAGTVYSEYDDSDVDLFDKNFFVVVDESSFKHVYKCLFNNGGAESVTQPVFGDVQFDASLYVTGDDYYETSDGYQWKYMYSIDSTTFDQFATSSFMPIVANTAVEDNAQNGTLDVVKIEEAGRNYNNHVSGQFTLSDIKVNSNTFLYRLPDGAGTAEGYYGNTILHLLSGTGAGQFSRVTGSELLAGVGVVVTIANSFSTTPDATTQYALSPEVKITGDGTESTAAIARAVIDTATANSVKKVEMLDIGKDYNFATATVLVGGPAAANGDTAPSQGDIVTPTSAEIRPIIPPPGGHGANSAVELGGSTLGMHVLFDGSENDTVIPENTFAQFGIIRDPLFANVEISHVRVSDSVQGSDGEFVEDEGFFQIKKQQLNANATVTNTSNVVESSTGLYTDFLRENDYVFLQDTSISTRNYIGRVDAVINTTAFRVTSNVNFSSTNTKVFLARVIATGQVDVIQTGELFAKKVGGKIEVGELLIGASSYAVANVTAIDVNDRINSPSAQFNFGTFNQTTRIVGTVGSGTFQKDEQVFQGSSLSTSTANAFVHSANATHLNLTRVTGKLNTAVTIVGATSNAEFSAPFTKYSGDLDPTSGSVVFLQNDVPVTRSNNQTEEVRVILEF